MAHLCGRGVEGRTVGVRATPIFAAMFTVELNPDVCSVTRGAWFCVFSPCFRDLCLHTTCCITTFISLSHGGVAKMSAPRFLTGGCVSDLYPLQVFLSLRYRRLQHFVKLKRDIRWLSLVFTNLGAKKNGNSSATPSGSPLFFLLYLK